MSGVTGGEEGYNDPSPAHRRPQLPRRPVAAKRRPLKLYHGGVPGLMPGEKLQPPSLSGVPSCSRLDSRHCQPDRIYLTTDSEEAAVYAALAPWHGHGDVYEVEPDGELEPEAISEDGTGSYAVSAATVVAVVRRAVGREEAAARMTAFLLRTAIEGPERPEGAVAGAVINDADSGGHVAPAPVFGP